MLCERFLTSGVFQYVEQLICVESVLFCFISVFLSFPPWMGIATLVSCKLKYEDGNIEVIPPILVAQYTGSGAPTDDKTDRISSLCAWLLG